MKANGTRTSGCREIPELQTPSSLPAPASVGDLSTWEAVIADLGRRRSVDRATLTVYHELVAGDEVPILIEALRRGTYRPRPPRRLRINKATGRGKTLYILEPLDELLMRVLNGILQAPVEPLLAAGCHSFRRGRGAKSAFAGLVGSGDAASLWTAHLDISDFFNSIDTADLVRRLPAEVGDDPLVPTGVRAYLGVMDVVDNGAPVHDSSHGVMAGTPLAPLLTNLYLRDVDDELDGMGVRWARYSDDVIVLGERDEVAEAEQAFRTRIAERGLTINESKTRRTAPGEPWDFLGLSYDHDSITLSANTRRKFSGRVRRRAHNLDRHRAAGNAGPADVCRLFARTLNRKLYGAGAADFSWAAWFFPVLTTTRHLRELDQLAQAQIRFAATGSRRARAHRAIPYEMLRDAGYIPLVTAYHASRAGRIDGDRFLARLERTDRPS
jgi:RNA-directed DNA polymerase